MNTRLCNSGNPIFHVLFNHAMLLIKTVLVWLRRNVDTHKCVVTTNSKANNGGGISPNIGFPVEECQVLFIWGFGLLYVLPWKQCVLFLLMRSSCRNKT